MVMCYTLNRQDQRVFIRLGKEFLSADFCLRKERREASYKPDVSLESILEESL